jgi:GNAT superfamily N-acetyltransferase
MLRASKNPESYTMLPIAYKTLTFGSKQQLASIALRDRILRQPLGLQYDPADLAAESDEIHIAALEGERVSGVLLLRKKDAITMKMRQVAVDRDQQRKGIGKAMVQFAELWCLENGYRRMELHARDTAIPFYLALGYRTEGDGFDEVGIPHHFMVRDLD